MSKNTTTMIFRLEKDLKTDFENVAKDMDLSASQLLRQMMRGFVNGHRQNTAQKQLPLAPKNAAPIQGTTPATAKKPKKGQKLAAAAAAQYRRKEQ